MWNNALPPSHRGPVRPGGARGGSGQEGGEEIGGLDRILPGREGSAVVRGARVRDRRPDETHLAHMGGRRPPVRQADRQQGQVRGEEGVEMTEPRTLRSRKLRALLWYQQNGLCAICGLKIGDTFHIDHKIPFKKTHRTNVHELQATHPECNLKKGAK